MTSWNRPYILEVAAHELIAERAGRPNRSLRQAAADNSVDASQLDRAREHLNAHLPQASESELRAYVHQEYLADGRSHGYVGEAENPSDWQLNQRAGIFYRPVALDESGIVGEGEPIPAVDEIERRRRHRVDNRAPFAD